MVTAIKEEDRVMVAVSCRGDVSCDSYNDYTNEDNLPIKILKEKGVIVAFARSNKYSDILLYSDQFISLIEADETVILKKVIPYVAMRIREEMGVKSNEPLKNLEFDNAIVIASDSRLFSITPKLYLREESQYVCFGRGNVNHYVIGCLDSSIGMPSEERVIKAVSYFKTVSGKDLFPVVATDTKTQIMRVLRER